MRVFKNILGKYHEVNLDLSEYTVNKVIEAFGYNPLQIHNIISTDNIHKPIFLCYLFYTQNLEFIIQHENSDLDETRVKNLISNINWAKEYDAYELFSTFNEACTEGSFDKTFLSAISGLYVKEDGEYLLENDAIKLTVSEGLLESFELINGTNEWVKYFKELDHEHVENYRKEALFNNNQDESKATNELNIQFLSLAHIPTPYDKNHFSLHRSKFGNINYLMIRVTHFGLKITEKEFKEYNINRYQIVGSQNQFNVYNLGCYNYMFENNQIKKIEKIN